MAAYYNERDAYAAKWLRNLIQAGHIAPGDVDERDIREVTPDDLRGYEQCHFFAGIGGWSLALRLAGWDDLRSVWTGSCPCQPFSVAGKGAGANDDRDLWPLWAGLIAECRPHRVFGEQVPGAIRHGWLDRVCADLEAQDYAVGAVVLGAHSVGAPHIRQRLWWVADAGRKRDERKLRLGDAPRQAGAHQGDGYQRERRGLDARGGGGSGRMADADTPGQRLERGGGLLDGQRPPHGHDTDGRAPEGKAAELSGDAWSDYIWLPCADGKARRIEPSLEPLVARLPASMGCDSPGEASPYRTIHDEEGRPVGQEPWRVGMLRAYGNAIVPQVAAAFIQATEEI